MLHAPHLGWLAAVLLLLPCFRRLRPSRKSIAIAGIPAAAAAPLARAMHAWLRRGLAAMMLTTAAARRRLQLHAAALSSGALAGLGTALSPALTEEGGRTRQCLAAGTIVGAAAAVWAASGGKEEDPAMSTLHPRWATNWDAGRYSKAGVGFHRAEVNNHLTHYQPEVLGELSGARVLVPLCGKSLDMMHLAEAGAAVVGAEGARRAVDEFFAENATTLGPVNTTLGVLGGLFTVKTASLPKQGGTGGSVAIWQGDFFQLRLTTGGGLLPDAFDCAYDRASLVAIDPSLRERYVAVLSALLKPGGVVLLSVVEHEPFEGGRLGPPFSINESEVSRLFSDGFEVTRLPKIPDCGDRADLSEHDYKLIKK
jgi:thiopurine S-methyltransferase